MKEVLYSCLTAMRQAIPHIPRLGVVLGSGLGGLVERVQDAQSVCYGDLPGFPVSTVEGHAGRFVFGRLGGVPVALMQGRVHYYEGYSMEQVVLPIRLLGLLGVESLLLTNAAGGLNPDFAAGDFMLLRDQIASFVPSPLRGENYDRLGVRFPDMSHIYDPDIAGALRQSAAEAGICLREGVYVQAPGPQYESPAEVRLFRALGGDAVGMSTACEAIAARHMGLRVGAVSCITNPAAGLSDAPLKHEDVQAMSLLRGEQFAQLITGALTRLNGEEARHD